MLALLLTIFVAFALVPAASAATEGTHSSAPDIRVYLDGKQVSTTVAPYIANGRTLIPIRAVTEALGAKVGWNDITKTVTITRAAKEIVMVIDDVYAEVNGERIELDVAPCITDGATFLPLRFVSEQFSQLVEWDGADRSIRITENMSFVQEGSNIEAWILGCGAILARVNRLDPYQVGMFTRTAANAAAERRSLSDSWSIDSREDLIQTILAMTDDGHAEQFFFDAELANSFSDAEFKRLLEMSSDMDKYMWPLVKSLSAKWGDVGIKAWDWFRMIHLAEWGYIAGYLEFEEVYMFVKPVAQRLRDTFTSWDEATENYMDGYAYWSRTDVSKENTSYKQRLKIYEDLKAEQSTKGLLFDPDVWTQPVIG